MREHKLKIEPQYFSQVLSDRKKFEVRKNDRDYQVGDKVILKEFFDGEYTGLSEQFFISYILDGIVGLNDEYVCFSLSRKYVASLKKE